MEAGKQNKNPPPAVTSHKIRAARAGLQPPRDFPQHAIARRMAVAIVDPLEAVQVAHDHSSGLVRQPDQSSARPNRSKAALRFQIPVKPSRAASLSRSEERRGGKECRSRGSPYH